MAKDLVAKVDEYEKDGQKKGKYINVGVLMSGENGEYMLLDPSVNLAGILIKQRLMNPSKASGSVMISVFDRDQQPSSQQQAPAPGVNNLDPTDIPF